MIKYKIKYKEGQESIHFVGPGQGDYALCGHDLSGDDFRHGFGFYKTAVPTSEKVNCKACVDVIKHCRQIKRNEYE